MEIRFYMDPETGQPHIYGLGISEEEVHQIMAGRGEDIPAGNKTRMKVGQTNAGRFLQVIYAPDEEPGSGFVITAFGLKGKAKKAYRRRQRRKGK